MFHFLTGKYDYASYNDLESGGSKVNSNHVEPNLAAPTRDGIYIYNDTIYLYKAPKLPNLKGHAHFDPSTSGIPLHKYKASKFLVRFIRGGNSNVVVRELNLKNRMKL